MLPVNRLQWTEVHIEQLLVPATCSPVLCCYPDEMSGTVESIPQSSAATRRLTRIRSGPVRTTRCSNLNRPFKSVSSGAISGNQRHPSSCKTNDQDGRHHRNRDSSASPCRLFHTVIRFDVRTSFFHAPLPCASPFARAQCQITGRRGHGTWFDCSRVWAMSCFMRRISYQADL